MAPLPRSDSTIPVSPGVTEGFSDDNFALRATVVVCAGISIYNAVELLILIISTFRRYVTVYFWSLFASTLSLIPYTLGYAFKFFETFSGNGKWASLSLLTIGWYVMITGQSVVLWSRLHLVVAGGSASKILFYTKWMIIVDAIILHIPTTVVTFGSFGDLATNNFVKAYNVVEKFQMTGFFVQETILSLVYIIATVKLLRESFRKKSRQLMYLLVCINIAIIALDVALLSIEYASLLILETVLKGVIYSIKLKLEFAILGRLVKFVRSDQRDPVENSCSTHGSSSLSRQHRQSQTRSTDINLEEGHARHLEEYDQPAHKDVFSMSRSQGSTGSNQFPLKELGPL
ncbi:hypothetical protein N7532_000325 [Penicillium argentinense]|uniref:DUF7703 domain-containing protein n=1 Tax=Penicillium argentinense TaxID=1131581 RepID=A0A9W9G5Z1_9EURO|nr:uncharacterized protein N7532_000325 [Penicillium argentinense]KAJ5112280.1 hypothetical protein N7532_000325 [Penicillium argentinense]